MIQLLPINDTSVYNMWWDSYPYSSISVSAAPLRHLHSRFQQRHLVSTDICLQLGLMQ